ncbi:hypothetical protein AAMO2058_001240100 [Amorphochlora amoebiformis]
MRIHSGFRPHQCSGCDRNFSDPANLARHYRTQHDVNAEKRYVCPDCNKRFFKNSTLRTHRLLHEGRKPYDCDFCGLKFRQQSNLKSHMRAVHSVGSNFTCSACGLRYRSFKQLLNHAHTEDGKAVKSLKCDICQKMFRSPVGLRDHIKRHGTVPALQSSGRYLCTHCGRHLGGSQALGMHMKSCASIPNTARVRRRVPICIPASCGSTILERPRNRRRSFGVTEGPACERLYTVPVHSGPIGPLGGTAGSNPK